MTHNSINQNTGFSRSTFTRYETMLYIIRSSKNPKVAQVLDNCLIELALERTRKIQRDGERQHQEEQPRQHQNVEPRQHQEEELITPEKSKICHVVCEAHPIISQNVQFKILTVGYCRKDCGISDKTRGRGPHRHYIIEFEKPICKINVSSIINRLKYPFIYSESFTNQRKWNKLINKFKNTRNFIEPTVTPKFSN